MSVDEYREIYAMGYMYGRIDAIQGADYDGRTPLAKRESTEVIADDDSESLRRTV
ncbi:hypothetical protein [Paenibacillus sp. FSL L8-0708]|uniref:hypothetical protein n=1 Tax=Paenibacillus sp. FSL L8-0708 TaxID=2975311 RepID=UPI0030FAB71E